MFVLTGFAAMSDALGALGPEMDQAVAGALFREGERIMARSKTDFVPVDTGALKASGIVKDPIHDQLGWSVVLQYGGPSVPYAVVQHETPWFEHRVGQWKYLEQPLMEAVDGMAERFAADLQL